MLNVHRRIYSGIYSARLLPAFAEPRTRVTWRESREEVGTWLKREHADEHDRSVENVFRDVRFIHTIQWNMSGDAHVARFPTQRTPDPKGTVVGLDIFGMETKISSLNTRF